jgi:uncharacterized protein (TIGR02217 family)
MSFHEVRFPTRLSLGALGGPERRTEIVTLVNGFEERNTPWAESRRSYDAGLGMQTLDDVADTIAFFESRLGQLYGFRWKDWSDFKSCKPSENISANDQSIGTGDGTSTVYRLVKIYSSGDQSVSRTITKPVTDTVKIAVDGVELLPGVDFTVEDTSGEVTFTSAVANGAAITAGFVFDVPVRFGLDRLDVSLTGFEAGEIPNIPVIELRLA